MATLPSATDIASFGFGTPTISNYLNSPQFQANTTYGELMGINPSMQQGISGFGTNGSGLGFNLDTFKLIGGGLSTIGNLWNAFQAQRLARDTFNFQKDFANRNLANQISSYNTALSDRARARGFTEGQSQDQIDSYIRENSLSR